MDKEINSTNNAERVSKTTCYSVHVGAGLMFI